MITRMDASAPHIDAANTRPLRLSLRDSHSLTSVFLLEDDRSPRLPQKLGLALPNPKARNEALGVTLEGEVSPLLVLVLVPDL